MKNIYKDVIEHINNTTRYIQDNADYYIDKSMNYYYISIPANYIPIPRSRFLLDTLKDNFVDIRCNYKKESPYSSFSVLPNYIKKYVSKQYVNEDSDVPVFTHFNKVPLELIALCTYEMTIKKLSEDILKEIIFEILL